MWRGLTAHVLPGRLRVRYPGLQGDSALAQRLIRILGGVPGVSAARASAVTGSLLVQFDPGVLSLGRLGDLLGLPAAPGAVAAAVPDVKQAARQALLTGGALAVVAAKRFLAGPSPLSRAWGTWDLAGMVTVAASYPFLRSGVHGALSGRGLNGELVIGLAGLAASVMRENLWGLSVLFLTSFTQWLYARALRGCAGRPGVADAQAGRLTEAARASAHRWGRLSAGAAAATGLLTGNWRRALAALVAAAPAASALSATLPLCAATAASARGGDPDGALERRAVAAAERNLAVSTVLNGLGLCLAAGGLVGPLGASLWHNLTSLAVVLGSLRLFSPSPPGRY